MNLGTASDCRCPEKHERKPGNCPHGHPIVPGKYCVWCKGDEAVQAAATRTTSAPELRRQRQRLAREAKAARRPATAETSTSHG